MKKSKKRILKIAKIFGKVLGAILILLLVIILFIRSPWGQNVITQRAVDFVSNKTGTDVAVQKLYVTFSGNVLLDGLYLEDKKGDTLVFSNHLEVDVALWPLITGSGVGVDNLEWNGVRANVYRKDSIAGFNYQFLIDAFASQDTTATQPKDTSSVNLTLGDFDIKDIKLNYNDEVSGMQAALALGDLQLEMNETDLENMRFGIGEVSLSDTKLRYKLSKTSTPADTTSQQTASADTSGTTLPSVSLERLVLNNVAVNYESIPDGLLADAQLKDFQLELPEAKLSENRFNVNLLALRDSKILVARQVSAADTLQEQKTSKDTLQTPFSWPDFDVEVASIDIANNKIEYYVNDLKPVENSFNPDALAISNFTFRADDIRYQEKEARVNLNQFNFTEASGIQLDQLGFNLRLSDTNTDLNDFELKLGKSQIKGNAALQYNSVAQFIESPETAQIALALNTIELNASTAYAFQPDLRSNSTLTPFAETPLRGNLRVNGKLSDVSIEQFQLNWGRNTSITTSGSLKNATDTENLAYNFPSLNIQSTKADLSQFVNTDSVSISFPENLRINGRLAGTTTSVDTEMDLTSSLGGVSIIADATFGDLIDFNTRAQVDSLQLGNLLQNEQLGSLSLNLDAKGNGSDVSALDAQLNATIQSFEYNSYAINNLNINGEFNDGAGTIAADYKDDNLNIELGSNIVLDTATVDASLDLNLIGADLQALGLVSQDIKGALKLNADFKGNAESFDLQSTLSDGVAVYDNDSYLLGELDINAYVRPDTTSVDIANRMLDLHLESNTDPGTFSAALQRHFTTYLSGTPEVDTVSKPVKLKLRGRLNQAPILNEVLVAGINQLDTVTISADFDERRRKLDASINAPFIDYGGNTLDSLAFQLTSDRDSLNFNLGLKGIVAGPVAIKTTKFDGHVADNELKLDFSSFDEEELLIHLASEISRENDDLQIHINPENLVLNRNSWSIPAENRIVLAESLTRFEEFILSRNNQQLQISNSLDGISQEHIGIDFQNFKLSSILSYLNPDQKLAGGALNGRFAMVNPNQSAGLLADLNITDFEVVEVGMGTLSLDASSDNGSDYNFDLGIKGGAADLDLEGSYVANPDAAQLDLVLNLNEIKMKTVEAFSNGELKEAQGAITGKINLSGTTTEPVYEGNINFENAGFKVAKLNTNFLLKNESMRLDNQGVYFDNFSITDAGDNAFTVNGEVGTEDLTLPTFDLTFKTTDFQVLNSTEEDFDMVYGSLSFDADASLTGDLNLPKLDLELSVGEETDVTYVLPASQAQIESMDGVVIFVNKENPDAILTETEEESYVLSGLDVNAKLKVSSESVFNVIVDEQTGDNLQIRGDADLDLRMEPNGRMNLTGAFEATDGHYELSLYNLVSRRFEIAEGSRVTWSGDPFNAELDVSAIYNVETSASGLATTADPGLQQRFRQDFDFQVYLNVDGELMAPVISFNLDMPKEEQGAAGGQVYARVQSLNQQEDQLNKQVFSLLVLNKFYPNSGSDGASGGSSNIARDNINDAITDQLNVFSDKLLGNTGVQLDFGLDSYTDYQGENGPQDRTTLDVAAQKKLLDDRLIVRVGSEVDLQGSPANNQQGSPVIGNVSLEYLLTEDGSYRLKGFRRNEFQNIIDGQLILSGISLIFTQEFNQFDELWRQMFGRTEEQEEEEETDEK